MKTALLPRRVLTPAGFEESRCVLIEAGRIAALMPAADCPADAERRNLDGDLLPGFIDLQVNGGGGVLLNDQPTVDGVATIAAAHRRFYEEYLAVMDLDAKFYLDTVRIVFQEHALVNGTLSHNGQLVDPSGLKNIGLMTIEGGRDDITGAGQCHAAHAVCKSIPDRLRLEVTEAKVGHYGLFSGRNWRERISPAIRDFIRTANVK